MPRGEGVGVSSMIDAVAVLEDFFRRLDEVQRTWLALSCSAQLDDVPALICDGVEADRWVGRIFRDCRRMEQRFGKLVHVVAVLDFQLSPLALHRMAREAERMIRAGTTWDVQQGTFMLRERVPRLRRMIDAWRDLRLHELDDAALWMYRDALYRQERDEARQLLDLDAMQAR